MPRKGCQLIGRLSCVLSITHRPQKYILLIISFHLFSTQKRPKKKTKIDCRSWTYLSTFFNTYIVCIYKDRSLSKDFSLSPSFSSSLFLARYQWVIAVCVFFLMVWQVKQRPCRGVKGKAHILRAILSEMQIYLR